MGVARAFIALGAVTLASGVALGAVGAHAAASAPHPEAARLIQTAVLYQFVHGLGLLLVGAIARQGATSRLLAFSGALMAAGIVAFCGSLYVLAFRGVSPGAAAPAGGIAFIIAWLLLAVWAVLERATRGPVTGPQPKT